jgi:hypothetical protein
MLNENSPAGLRPFAVSVSKAAKLLDSGESTVWAKLARGDLEAIKDGARTKVTLASIERHVSTWPRAKFLKPRPRVARRLAPT